MLAVWCLLLAGVSIAQGIEPPGLFTTPDHGVHVDIAGLDAVHKNVSDGGTLSLTLTGCEGQQYTTVVKPVVADLWRTNIGNVMCKENEAPHYVIKYQTSDDVIVKTGIVNATRGEPFTEPKLVSCSPPTPPQADRKTVTVLYDDFSSGRIDHNKWSLAATADGGGGSEFNMYTPEPVNSYVKNATLFIRPTFTVDTFGKDFLWNGTLNVTAKWGRCTDPNRSGCYRKGWNRVPPIMSAYLTSRGHIRYGKVEVVAKLPRGDWTWPAIWMLPTESYYGGWPRSGEIDIMESRGNAHYHTTEGWSIGNDDEFDTIHYGAAWNDRKSLGCSHTLKGQCYADQFHLYWIDWTEDYIRMGVDNITVFSLPTPSEGFWKEGHFTGQDIWAKGGKNAPFDRPFYLILNVAVGGAFFNEKYKNAPYPQPWADNSWDKMMQFWSKRHLWQGTWQGENSAMQIQSVKMMQYLD